MRLCERCNQPAIAYVMGPYVGDWAEYVCDDHIKAAKAAYRGAVVEKIR